MGRKCSAPNCRGNYDVGDKVSVFGFPKNEILRKKWVSAIKREKTFQPTDYNGVCEKHFVESDIVRETSAFDEKTMRTLTAKLKNPRPKIDAVPKILPNCPAERLSTTVTPRQDIEKHQEIIKYEKLTPQEQFLEENSFLNFQEFRHVLNKNIQYVNESKVWDVIRHDDQVLFLIVDKKPLPKIKLSVVVDCKCNVRVFNDILEIEQIDEELRFPFCVKNIIELNSVLTKAMNFQQALEVKKQDKSHEIKYHVQLIESMLRKLLDLSENCIENLKSNYNLPEKNQNLVTDRQTFEDENKLRLQNFIPMQLTSSKLGKLVIDLKNIENIVVPDEEYDEEIIECEGFEINLNLDEYFLEIDSILPNLTYIAEICLRRSLKKMNCVTCARSWALEKDSSGAINKPENSLIKDVDLGLPILPHSDVVSVVSINYIVVQQLISSKNETQFLQSTNQRQIAMSLTIASVCSEINFENDGCADNDQHTPKLLKFISRTATNILLNQYNIKKRNQEYVAEQSETSSNKRRKAEAVKKSR